ncbi:hypothetical protein [Tenacibaculum sp. 190524A05c]|uniref:SH3 domain-containing protein n=1 Tax=Tenacibaculum platacis TaxID=3137852 RepID=A0ABM9P2D3_9FLAO
MKYTIIFQFLLIFSLSGCKQIQPCDAVVYWKHEGLIKIYNKPNGKELTSLQNDLQNENFLNLKIKEVTNDFFLVEISLTINGTKQVGWIKKNSYIGAFMKGEKEYMDLTLYNSPKDELSEIKKIKNWKAGFVTIEDFQSKWTKVAISYKGKRVSGWIQSNKLCPNNYSTCN